MTLAATKISSKDHSDPFFNKIKASYERQRLKIRADLDNSKKRKKSGPATAMALSHLVDATLKKIANRALSHLPPDSQPALIATGGYGRGEMAPFSDVDLLFLLPDESRLPNATIEKILQTLWSLGLKTGHAVRTVEECLDLAKKDITVATNLLEGRFICGNRKIHAQFRKSFDPEIKQHATGSFVAAKLQERDRRHKKMGDSRYRLEPNIKEGKGGLRDLQTLFWIAQFLYRARTPKKLAELGLLTAEEARTLADAQDFLWTLRCHLHFLCGRAEDRLTFDVQPDMARRLRYTDRRGQKGVERFMKHYFLVARNIGELTRVICTALEESGRSSGATRGQTLAKATADLAPFLLDRGRLNIPTSAHFKNHPADMIALFRAAQASGLDIHADAARSLNANLKRIDNKTRQDKDTNRQFLDIMTAERNIAKTLRRMNESGILGAFVPDFGRIVAHMQYDMYHTYTADEHTLQAVAVLEQLESGVLRSEARLACDLFPKIKSRRALFVAMFLHDIAKGRGGMHQDAGSKIARELGPRFGLNAEETDTAAWLVEQHLVMSDFASRRNLEDQKTIDDFAAIVRSPERLRLLTILTTADIMAVGETRWNGWKATVIETLFNRTMEILTGDPKSRNDTQRIDAVRAEIRTLLESDREKFESLDARVTPYYWLSFPPETIARHARILHKAPDPLIHVISKNDFDLTEITVAAADQRGLFARLAGAISVAGGSIAQARIFTLKDGTALDIFYVQGPDGGPHEDKARLAKTIRAAIEDRLDIQKELSGRRRPQHNRLKQVSVPPRVLIDNEASVTSTVIEVNGKDRPGLLYNLARRLTTLGLQISAAKISTFGSMAVDVFYVRDGFGLKILTPAAIARIENTLLETLNQ